MLLHIIKDILQQVSERNNILLFYFALYYSCIGASFPYGHADNN
jgi:hypothetical protein